MVKHMLPFLTDNILFWKDVKSFNESKFCVVSTVSKLYKLSERMLKMDFIDEIKQFGGRVKNLKDKLPTEEATKASLIMPFFQMLGYDVFNPDEFMPEFTADVGIKKGEKVDYAILSEGKPVILIEAKWVQEDLKRHDSQLFRYFGTTEAKFAKVPGN